jgi:carboxypeptidase family protein
MITPPPRTVLGNSSRTGSSFVRGSGVLGLTSWLCALALVACGDPNDPQTFGSLSGMVRDAVRQAPLEGVRVAVAGREGQSGADGRYKIDSIPAGTHQVSAEAAGYVSRTLDAEIRPGIDNLYDVELTATEPAGLTITTSALPQATVDVPYQASLRAAGGDSAVSLDVGEPGPAGLAARRQRPCDGYSRVPGGNASSPGHGQGR